MPLPRLPRAAKLLAEMGYTNVKDYAGGKQHWKEGGLPVEEASAQPA
ncbi:MAG: rhodanese-like domain-containing protein [Gemmatimonadota bacterium]